MENTVNELSKELKESIQKASEELSAEIAKVKSKTGERLTPEKLADLIYLKAKQDKKAFKRNSSLEAYLKVFWTLLTQISDTHGLPRGWIAYGVNNSQNPVSTYTSQVEYYSGDCWTIDNQTFAAIWSLQTVAQTS